MASYPQEVKIVEVGPRDGLQNEAKAISTEDKVTFIKKLSETGLKEIEVGAFVHPKKVPQMAGSEDVIKALPSNGVTYSALVPNLKGLERAIETGVKRIAVFTAASDAFTEKNINMTIKESLDVFKPVIDQAIENKIDVRGYVSTCFVCPYAGEVKKEKVLEVSKALQELGVYEISLGDTIGSAKPQDVTETVGHILNEIPKELIALHMHDTYKAAVANVRAGLELGIATYDSSAGGLGGCPYAPGASGNVATEDLIKLFDELNISHGVDINKLAQASEFIKTRI